MFRAALGRGVYASFAPGMSPGKKFLVNQRR
jgi:hypothetical protein